MSETTSALGKDLVGLEPLTKEQILTFLDTAELHVRLERIRAEGQARHPGGLTRLGAERLDEQRHLLVQPVPPHSKGSPGANGRVPGAKLPGRLHRQRPRAGSPGGDQENHGEQRGDPHAGDDANHGPHRFQPAARPGSVTAG